MYVPDAAHVHARDKGSLQPTYVPFTSALQRLYIPPVRALYSRLHSFPVQSSAVQPQYSRHTAGCIFDFSLALLHTRTECMHGKEEYNTGIDRF